MVNLTKRRRARSSSGSHSDPSSPSTASNPEHGLAILAAAASLLEVGRYGGAGDGSTGGGRRGGAGGGQLVVTAVAASSKHVPLSLSGGRVPASGRIAAIRPCSAPAARGIGKRPRQDPPVPASASSMQQTAGGMEGSSSKNPRGMVHPLPPQAAPAPIPSAGAPPPSHQAQPTPTPARDDRLQLRGLHQEVAQEAAPTYPVIKAEAPDGSAAPYGPACWRSSSPTISGGRWL